MSPARGVPVDRVYVALTPEDLVGALAAGHLPAEAPVHAVTPALRAQDPDADLEELELEAFLDAASSSLRLLAGAGGAALRLVLAADVPGASVRARPATPDGATARATDGATAGATDGVEEPLTRVDLDTPVAVGAVVSAHVDEPDAEGHVRAAAAAPASAAAQEAAQEHDLLWYDATELDALAATLSRGAG